MPDDDDVRLFDEDRRRFLTLYREFLQNQSVPVSIRQTEARSTLSVLRQMGELLGVVDGQ